MSRSECKSLLCSIAVFAKGYMAGQCHALMEKPPVPCCRFFPGRQGVAPSDAASPVSDHFQGQSGCMLRSLQGKAGLVIMVHVCAGTRVCTMPALTRV